MTQIYIYINEFIIHYQYDESTNVHHSSVFGVYTRIEYSVGKPIKGCC